MTRQNNVKEYGSELEQAEATARFIILLSEDAVEARGRFVLSLSGGHTPELLYTLLSKPPFCDQMPWSKTFVFWGDERCLPAGDEQNNAHMAKTSLLNKVAIPPLNLYPVRTELPPQEAAMAYENSLKIFFGDAPPQFDLILLGLGENGHTASIFPGSDVIHDTTRLVKEVYVAEQNMYRITMTAKLINEAHNIIFLVAGSSKAQILDTILSAPYQPDKFPAQLIKPVTGQLYWFVDKAAANLLSTQEK